MTGPEVLLAGSGVLLAVDGGNSKTDAALIDADGRVLAASRGPTVSHQQVGLAGAGTALRRQVDALVAAAGLTAPAPVAGLAVLCLAGVDLPSDERALAAVHGRSGIGGTVVLENDTLAALRAGSPVPWGVGVVLGAGINAVGVAPDGRRARFAALGAISGDHGGGSSLGMDALGAAVRAQDRRGPTTMLATTVPAHFGLRRPLDVTMAIYGGRLDEARVSELAPVAVAAAAAGDEVALAILQTLAEEVASFVTAAIGRLAIGRLAVPVVLSGGVARGAGDLLAGPVTTLVRRVAPEATVMTLVDPPVVGAALLALDRVAPGDDRAQRHLRAALTHATLVPTADLTRPGEPGTHIAASGGDR